jgi:hypothetical protein
METDYETFGEWRASLRQDYPKGGKIECVMLLSYPPRMQYTAWVEQRPVSTWTEPTNYAEPKSDW